jgi:hypothetical protein
MLEKYPLLEELGKTMFVFEKFGKYYGPYYQRQVR